MNRFCCASLRRLPLLCVLLWGCGGDDFGSIRNLASAGGSIICFGDSLTEGVGASAGEDYPAQLSRRLRLPVINAGRRGDTAAEALERLQRDVLEKNPRLVIVLIGGNDFLRRTPLAETLRNLRAIVARIQGSGAMVAMAGMKLGLFRDEYGAAFEQTARETGSLYVAGVMKDIFNDARFRSDAVHPNDGGYRLMAERVAEKIKPLLAAADRRRGERGGG